MVSEKRQFDFENRVIDLLEGKMNLLQNSQERRTVIMTVLNTLLRGEEFPQLKQFVQDTQWCENFITNFLSYGVLTKYLSDFDVEDIIINNLNPIYIHHGQKGFIPTNEKFKSQQELNILIKKLIMFTGRKKKKKLMDLELPNLEGRVNIAYSPFGPQLTITKAKSIPLSIFDLIKRGTLNYSSAAQLWLYFEGMSIRPANVIIAGGPGVGKTTLLNALFCFIPASHRMVVIEDTLELNTVMEESCSRLESDEDCSLADLVKNSLRMRPERIIIGEVRGEEARDMITACNIGKYCTGTVHALTSREAIVRLQNEPMNVPEELVNLIDIFIVLKRYHVKNKLFRVIDEISETSGMEQVKTLLSTVYKYNYERHEQYVVNPSTVFRDKLAEEVGVTPRDIMKEHLLRAYLLEYLDKNNLRTAKEVTTFCQAYSKDPDTAVSALGLNRSKLLKD